MMRSTGSYYHLPAVHRGVYGVCTWLTPALVLGIFALSQILFLYTGIICNLNLLSVLFRYSTSTYLLLGCQMSDVKKTMIFVLRWIRL